MTKRKALLIGVETCKEGDLHGPGFDVALMRALVHDRFGFAVDVVPDRLATRAGILGAFERLVADASPDDSLLFYFAGHGTRIDGRSGDGETVREAICPQDFEREGAARAILDFELHELFASAQAREARLTAIFDCCFAGGVPIDDVLRRLALEARESLGGLGDMIGDALTRPRVRSIPSAGDVLEPLKRGLTEPSDSRISFRISEHRASHERGPAAVIFGACVAGGLAREQQYGDEVHGVFTHHLADVLRASDAGITNRAVRDAVREAVMVESNGETDSEKIQRAIVAPEGAEGRVFLG